MNRIRILVVEDDTHIRTGLMDALESEGYQAVAAADGKQALALAGQHNFDLMLLDIMMPGISGYEVCREIRRKDVRTPIIMVTAKGEEVDKVVGLELGADDYITKPFGVRELLARVAAVLRRSRARATPVADDLPEELVFGAARIQRRAFTGARGRHTFELTVREIRLVECLARHPGEVLSREQLLNEVWGVEYYGTTRTLDQHIAQLRKKVEADPAEPRHILTVHGVGYRYQPIG
jgi:DNA-binding response OmpR family regulator